MIKNQLSQLQEDLKELLNKEFPEEYHVYLDRRVKKCPFYQGECFFGHECSFPSSIKGVDYIGFLHHFNDLSGMSVEQLYNSHACPKEKFILSETERTNIEELFGDFNGL